MLGLSVESGAKVRIIFECAKDLAFFSLYDEIFSCFFALKRLQWGLLWGIFDQSAL